MTSNTSLNTSTVPIPVTSGGTGLATMTTAYAPVIAGTTATGNLQVASTGQSNSGYVLTSTGSSSLPTWQAVPGGSSIFTQVSVAVTPTQMLNNVGVDGVLLVAAQGANTMIVPVSVVYEYKYNSVI